MANPIADTKEPTAATNFQPLSTTILMYYISTNYRQQLIYPAEADDARVAHKVDPTR